MSSEPRAVVPPYGTKNRSPSVPSPRALSAVVLVVVGCLGGVVGASVVLFATRDMRRSETPRVEFDMASLEARVSELESRPVPKPGRAPSFSTGEVRRGGEPERQVAQITDLTEHPRFASAIGQVIQNLEAARQAEKADEKTRRRVDRILAFTDSLTEELRLTETQRLEVARVLTDESSRYRRAKEELSRVSVEEGLTPRETRERKAAVGEQVDTESRTELSRILSPDQLTEFLRIREEEGMDADD